MSAGLSLADAIARVKAEPDLLRNAAALAASSGCSLEQAARALAEAVVVYATADEQIRKAQAAAVRGAAHGISGPLAGTIGEAAGRLVVSALEKIADEIESGGGERR